MLLSKRNERWVIFLVFLLKIIIWVCLVVSGLKLIFHWKAHLMIQCKPLFNPIEKVSTCGLQKIKICHLQTTLNLMIGHQLDRWYKPKKIGPKIYLWGTPALALVYEEICPFKVILSFKSDKTLSILQEIPFR